MEASGSRPPTVITLNRAHSHSAHSSTTSLNSRAPGIRYPTVTVDASRLLASPSAGGTRSGSMDRLREECARLRLRAEEITTDSNRRVEMHVAEIRMLKEESRRLKGSITQLEGERNKARQLAHEWHKFARYSSDLVKQEVRGYDGRLREAHAKMRQLREENEELKQLCFYLDEQRQNSAAARRLSARCSEEESDDQGCGSSDHSLETDDRGGAYCLQKEDSLRRICQRVGGGGQDTVEPGGGETGMNDRLLQYIHSLESRIKHLELATTTAGSGGPGGSGGGGAHSDSWRCSITPESEDLTVMEREWDRAERAHHHHHQHLQHRAGSPSGTMTSSGTTFCSSEMDESVFVDGTSETSPFPILEVRTLPPIEEELSQAASDSKRLSAEVALSALLPPCMEPLSSTTIGRYRTDGGRYSDIGVRAASEDSSILRLPNGREPQSVPEAVEALRLRERATENPYGRWSANSEPKYLTAL